MMPAAVLSPGSAWTDCIQYTTGGLSSPFARLHGVARSEIRSFVCCNELYERRPIVKAFDFTQGPECIATESLRSLTQVWGPQRAEPRHGAARMV